MYSNGPVPPKWTIKRPGMVESEAFQATPIFTQSSPKFTTDYEIDVLERMPGLKSGEMVTVTIYEYAFVDRSLNGNSEITKTFLGPDLSPPVMLDRSYPNNYVDHPGSATLPLIDVTFDEDVRIGRAGTISCRPAGGNFEENLLRSADATQSSSKVISFRLNKDIPGGLAYVCFFTEECIRDLAGNYWLSNMDSSLLKNDSKI